MPDEWAVVAADTDDERPRHLDTIAGIEWWCGAAHEFTEPVWNPLPFSGDLMWVVWVGGTQAALDALAAEADAYTQSEYGITDEQIATALNNRTGRSRTYEEWTQRLFVNTADLPV